MSVRSADPGRPVDPIDRLPIAVSDGELEAAGIPVQRRDVDPDALSEFQARTGLSCELGVDNVLPRDGDIAKVVQESSLRGR